MSPAMLFVFIGDSRLTVPSFSSGTEALSSLPSETYPLVHLVNKHLITLYARDPGNAIKGKKKKKRERFPAVKSFHNRAKVWKRHAVFPSSVEQLPRHLWRCSQESSRGLRQAQPCLRPLLLHSPLSCDLGHHTWGKESVEWPQGEGSVNAERQTRGTLLLLPRCVRIQVLATYKLHTMVEIM